MHFIINGIDHGPCVSDIPYKETPLHAVVDVYGTTKQVKIIQLYESKYHQVFLKGCLTFNLSTQGIIFSCHSSLYIILSSFFLEIFSDFMKFSYTLKL